MKKWYVAKTGNHQGLVVEEETGKNIAVCYDKADAPLLAAAPALLEACKIAWNELIDWNKGHEDSEAQLLLKAAIAQAEKEG